MNNGQTKDQHKNGSGKDKEQSSKATGGKSPGKDDKMDKDQGKPQPKTGGPKDKAKDAKR